MRCVDENKIKEIGKVLLNVERPLKERFRALFSLKNIGGPLAIDCISKCFNDSSSLLKHELAYCLGQMGDEKAIPMLIQVLENETEAPIVRHEAAEALGAVGVGHVRDILQKYTKCDIREIAETCQLSLKRLDWVEENSGKEIDPENVYSSIDPAPASTEKDVETLRDILLNEKLSHFERYKAMFALRNLGTKQSALALTSGLESQSALFSHEVAFVLGQLQDKNTVPALVKCLQDTSKNEMVRHECAEALGAIATEECLDVLREYLTDENRVVRESCEVALDMCDYENSVEFQYALV